MHRKLLGALLVIVTLAITPMHGQDLTTRLATFLNDLYAGNIGTSISTGFVAKNGTAAAPSYSFATDSASGSYLIGAGDVGFSAAGVRRWDYNQSAMTSTLPLNITNDVSSYVSVGTSGGNSGYVGTASQLITGALANRLGVRGNTGIEFSGDGGTTRHLILSSAGLLTGTDNTLDIGASGASRPRTGYFGTSVVAPLVTARLVSSGAVTSVASVGANSCGTTAPTIVGTDNNGVITVGATSGTQCRVTFTVAAPVARDCTVTDSTTTIATRATAVTTTTTDFFGAFVAGDLVTYICVAR